MSNTFFVIIVVIIGGIAAVFQAQFNGIMDKGMGTLESVFVTYVGGGIVIALIMVFMRGGNLSAISTLPWYVLTAGLFGLVIIGSLSYSVPRLGLVPVYTLIVATQFILGALIDHYGLLGADVRLMTLPKIAGVGVLMVGVWLIMS